MKRIVFIFLLLPSFLFGQKFLDKSKDEIIKMLLAEKTSQYTFELSDDTILMVRDQYDKTEMYRFKGNLCYLEYHETWDFMVESLRAALINNGCTSTQILNEPERYIEVFTCDNIKAKLGWTNLRGKKRQFMSYEK